MLLAFQLLSHVWLLAIPWMTACQAPLSSTISWCLIKFISIELVILPNHLTLCYPFLLLPTVFPSIRVFFNESALHIRWPKYWTFSFSIGPSNEYSELISFRIDWLELLSIQGTLKSLLKYDNLKASILQHSAFFMVQLSHPYMTTGKTIALTIQTFVGKVMPLLFNMLSRFVIVLLPRSKHLLISWLHSPSAVFLEPRKIKICHSFPCSSSIWYEVMGLDAMLAFWMLSFKPAFSLSSFTLIKKLYSSSLLSAMRVISCVSEVVDISPAILISACWVKFLFLKTDRTVINSGMR